MARKDFENMREYLEKMKKLILNTDNKNIMRFFALDNRVYKKEYWIKKLRN